MIPFCLFIHKKPCLPQYTCDAEGRYTPNPAYHAWIRTEQSVQSWLNATLTQEIFLDVHHLSSSRDVWLALERRFVDQSTAKEIQLKYDMQHQKKGTKKTKTVYLQELKGYV